MGESTVRRLGALHAAAIGASLCLLAGCSNGAGNVNTETTSSTGSALSKAEAYAAQVVDSSAGHAEVDPLTLHPVPYFGWDQWFADELYKCWSVDQPPAGAPADTKVVCFHGATSFQVGDGSLYGQPGQRDNSMAPDATGVRPCGFRTYNNAIATMSAIRYYNGDLNQTVKIRTESWRGTVYNGVTGKSIPLEADSVWYHWMDPVDGTGDTEYFTAYGNVWGVLKANGGWLSKSSGEMTYSPNWEALLKESGNHPIDECGNLGDCSALVPVCDALR